jgi:lipocalin-like protein
MNRRTAAFVSILALSGAGAASPPASPKLADQILGRWRLVSIENRDDASKPWELRYGSSPTGYIRYDRDGTMSVQIARMPRPKFASGRDQSPTPEEGREAYLGYVAYFGTYTVDEASRVVTHHVESSLMPSFAGTDQKRPATLEGDRLTLSDEKTFRVVWERPKS